MRLKWRDEKGGERSAVAVRVGDGLNGFSAAVRQPDAQLQNWETGISLCSGGKSLSLASGKIDAVMALRRDAEKLVKALGGAVVWVRKRKCPECGGTKFKPCDEFLDTCCKAAVCCRSTKCGFFGL